MITSNLLNDPAEASLIRADAWRGRKGAESVGNIKNEVSKVQDKLKEMRASVSESGIP